MAQEATESPAPEKPAEPAATPDATPTPAPEAPASTPAAPKEAAPATPPAAESAPAGDATPAAESAPADAPSGSAADVVDSLNAALDGGAPVISDGEAPVNAAGEAATVVEKVGEAAEKAAEFNVPGEFMLFFGIGLMVLFLWYWSTEVAKTRRIVGSFLAIIVTAASLFFFEKMKLKEGIELQGGVSMIVQLEAVEGRTIDSDSLDQAIKVLQRRLNATGTQEVLIAPQGQDRIFIQVPGLSEEALMELKIIIEKVARLEFAILHPESYQRARQVQLEGGFSIPGYKVVPDAEPSDMLPEQRQQYLVPSKADMQGKHIVSASPYYGNEGYAISVKTDGEGAKIMGNITRQHVGDQMAMILDGEVLSAPTIQGFFSSEFSITGRFDQEEVVALASALENPLENKVEVIQSNYISPTMGEETVSQGIGAGVAGLAITLVFIVLYYRFAGILALIGLSISIAIIFGAMALFKSTLTLPGIAGIILTIGIAIDANVLIYERLREEMSGERSIGAAIRSAYDKAFSAIFDANVTTLITALILYVVATGTVKGFAVTLIIGIVATLFSALLVTRVCFNWATETGFLKKLSFMSLMPNKQIDFLGKRRAFLLGSAVLLAISLVVVPVVDPRGVDLKGGSMVTIQAVEGLDKDKVEAVLADMELTSEAIVQTQQPVNADGEFIIIRGDEKDGQNIKDTIAEVTGFDLGTAQVESVGSQVGGEMLQTSLLALGIGLVAILIWVTVRFEFAFALGAIAALFHDLLIVMGIMTLLGREVSLITVGAFLTIAGYSINDTIVIFDRVREGLRTKRGDIKDVMNYCLNATLGRTLLTSLTTLTVVVTLALFGGPAAAQFRPHPHHRGAGGNLFLHLHRLAHGPVVGAPHRHQPPPRSPRCRPGPGGAHQRWQGRGCRRGAGMRHAGELFRNP